MAFAPPGTGCPRFDLPLLIAGIIATVSLLYALILQNDTLLLVAFADLVGIVLFQWVKNIRAHPHYKHDVHLKPLENDQI